MFYFSGAGAWEGKTTAMYAAPGQIVEVTVPKNLVGKISVSSKPRQCSSRFENGELGLDGLQMHFMTAKVVCTDPCGEVYQDISNPVMTVFSSPTTFHLFCLIAFMVFITYHSHH